jgi:hypothetical protein
LKNSNFDGGETGEKEEVEAAIERHEREIEIEGKGKEK